MQNADDSIQSNHLSTLVYAASKYCWYYDSTPHRLHNYHLVIALGLLTLLIGPSRYHHTAPPCLG